MHLKGMGRWDAARFAVPVFLGPALLFCIEPMLGRTMLPLFGGSASVWTVCLAAYQVLLLAGSAYAYWISRAGRRYQRAVHLGLLLVSAAWLLCFAALRRSPVWTDVPAAGMRGGAWGALVRVIAAIGLPFAVLSAGSTLLQKWAADAGGGRETYRLYVFSNAGSFAGLVLYALVIEPFVPLGWQWAGAAAGLAVYFGLCAVAAKDSKRTTARESAGQQADNSKGGAALWLALPALSAFVLNSTTTHLSTDVSPFPLMWVILLGAFLATYAIGFSRVGERLLPLWLALAAVSAWLAISALKFGEGNYDVFARNFAAGLGLILFGGCFLHSWLCRARPAAGRLTEYYLCISLGGAVGGIASGILPALAFDTVAEYPAAIMLVAAAALLAAATALRRETMAVARLFRPGCEFSPALAWAASAVVLLAAWCAVAARQKPPYAKLYARGRNFYGCWSVAQGFVTLNVDVPAGFGKPKYPITILQNGNTTHGIEPEDEIRRNGATAYYGELGGGLAFSLHPNYAEGRPMSVAIVGMGAGTQAWYGREGDSIRYFEINPAVVEAANRHFTFLERSKAETSVVVADARKALEAEAASGADKYDVLVVDAYSGDSVPFHLITRQAFELYASRIRDGGILALHISNWHIDLLPVCKAAARHLGMKALGTVGGGGLFTWDASWVFLSRQDLVPPTEGVAVTDWGKVRDIPLPDDERGSILPFIRFHR